MTKLEEKLEELKFNKCVEQNGDIFYSKSILAFKLNSTNTEIKTIYTYQSEGFSEIELIAQFDTLSEDLKKLIECQREIRLEEISNAMYEECD